MAQERERGRWTERSRERRSRKIKGVEVAGKLM